MQGRSIASLTGKFALADLAKNPNGTVSLRADSVSAGRRGFSSIKTNAADRLERPRGIRRVAHQRKRRRAQLRGTGSHTGDTTRHLARQRTRHRVRRIELPSRRAGARHADSRWRIARLAAAQLLQGAAGGARRTSRRRLRSRQRPHGQRRPRNSRGVHPGPSTRGALSSRTSTLRGRSSSRCSPGSSGSPMARRR